MKNSPAATVEVQRLADGAKAVIDRVIARFARKKPSDALARRMELVIRREIRRNAALAALHDVAPVVTFQQDGRPHVMFFTPVGSPANDRRSAA